MTGLNDSSIDITLNGTVEQLVATPNALLKASRFKGGLSALNKGLQQQDVDTYIILLAIGLSHKKNFKPTDNEMVETIFKSGGLVELMPALLEYLFMLQNGGRRYEQTDDVTGESDSQGKD